MRSFPAPSLAAAADWRAFGGRRYRAYRNLAIAQGFIGALTGPAITLPLLLALGASPSVATFITVLPAAGTMAQRWLPNVLGRSDGNLRRVVLRLVALGEPRGLPMAAIVAGVALGWLPAALGVALIAIVGGVLGALGAIGYSLQQTWFQIILPEDQRRLVAPRAAGIALGMGAVVLTPLGLTIDGLVAGIGLWVYAAVLFVAGLWGLVPVLVLRRLPPPGRLRMPAMPWHDRANDRLRRHGNVMTLALLSAGLSPFLSVYAISVLGTGVGFAILVNAVSAGTLVVSSIVASAHLRHGSASRLLRTSFVLRGGTLFLALAAHPANPLAPFVLLSVAVLMAIGDTAGQLAASERLMRLATGPAVLAFHSHAVVRIVGAYTTGVGIASMVMLLGGYGAFAILFVAAGTGRMVAARATEVSAPATVPAGAGAQPA